jgi:hypothetical protein
MNIWIVIDLEDLGLFGTLIASDPLTTPEDLDQIQLSKIVEHVVRLGFLQNGH